MEVLYKKLYDKFKKLKERRLTELDDSNNELEKRFVEYVAAADGFIEQLKLENEKLRAAVKDLTNETSLLRSGKDEQYNSFQQLLLEERKNNRQLSQEISRQQKLQEEKQCSSSGRTVTNSEQEEGDACQLAFSLPSDHQSTQTGLKRPRVPDSLDAAFLSPKRLRVTVESPLKPLSAKKQTLDGVDHQHQAEGCVSITGASGACNCLFKNLLERLVGMKVSMDKQSEGLCISVLHQSSGYSFRLIWMKKVAASEEEEVDEDTELLYQVSSLGTFERVAPDWMREVMLFSVSMCPLFFERVTRVIKQC